MRQRPGAGTLRGARLTASSLLSATGPSVTILGERLVVDPTYQRCAFRSRKRHFFHAASAGSASAFCDASASLSARAENSIWSPLGALVVPCDVEGGLQGDKRSWVLDESGFRKQDSGFVGRNEFLVEVSPKPTASRPTREGGVDGAVGRGRFGQVRASCNIA